MCFLRKVFGRIERLLFAQFVEHILSFTLRLFCVFLLKYCCAALGNKYASMSELKAL